MNKAILMGRLTRDPDWDEKNLVYDKWKELKG